jgi:hypothetical protein
VPVQIIHNHATSKRFEALVDTGTDYCLFDALIGASIGIRVNDGPEGFGRYYRWRKIKGLLHDIKLVVGADIVEIKAAFSWDITSNLLGQTGFFDNSAVSFHPAFKPPCFDVERKGPDRSLLPSFS